MTRPEDISDSEGDATAPVIAWALALVGKEVLLGLDQTMALFADSFLMATFRDAFIFFLADDVVGVTFRFRLVAVDLGVTVAAFDACLFRGVVGMAFLMDALFFFG